jgi:hypothetical protein
MSTETGASPALGAAAGSARQALAAEIARALFTDGMGKRAKRLIMEIGGWRDGGGWSEEGAALQIERVLETSPNAPSSATREDER